MPSAAIAFGNLGPFDIALICVAVHLLFHARKLAFVTSDSARRELLEREFFVPPLLLGVAVGASLSVMPVPEPVALWGLVAVAVVAAAVTVAARWSGKRRYPWDLLTLTVFLLTWDAAGELVALL